MRGIRSAEDQESGSLLMNKDRVFSLFTVILVLGFCFVVFEATGRFFEEMDRYVVTKEFDPVLGWRLKTGSHKVRPAGWLKQVPIEINSFGMRGEEFPAKTPEGEKRVMVLGDSFVFSRHFPLDQTFTAKMEKLLSAKDGVTVRVLNAGVPGYGTGQELLFMKQLAEKGILPDAYILMIFPNDILDNLRLSYGEFEAIPVKPGFELDAQGRAVLKQMPVNDLGALEESFRRPEKTSVWKLRSVEFVRQSIAAFFESNPELLKLMMNAGIRIKVPRKPGLLNGWYDEKVIGQGIPLMKGLLREMKEEAARHGATFEAVIIPSQVQIYPQVYERILSRQFSGDSEVKAWIGDPLKPQRLIGGICDDLGIEYVDLYPVFKAQEKKKLYIPRDGHFDHDAHEIVAETLAARQGAAK